jgi:hypothetical protein
MLFLGGGGGGTRDRFVFGFGDPSILVYITVSSFMALLIFSKTLITRLIQNIYLKI